MEHHTFGHADVEAKCIQMTELFSPHLNFFGGKLDVAEEALRGFILLDEVGMCPHSTMGSAVPWRQLESPPSLDCISVGLREQFLDERASTTLNLAIAACDYGSISRECG